MAVNDPKTKVTTESARVRADLARLITEIDSLSSERLDLHAEIARIEKQRDRADRTVEILRQCAQLMNSSLGLTDVLGRVLHQAVELMQAERGFIALRHENESLEVHVFHNLERPEYEAEQRISQSIVERVLATGLPVVTTDAQSDPRFNAEESIIAQQIRSIVCVPLLVRGSTIGAVYLDSRVLPNLFGMGDPELLQSFANLAGPAIENARLLGVERARVRDIEQLESLQGRIIETVAGGVLAVDAEDRITLMNDAAERIFLSAAHRGAHRHITSIARYIPGIVDMLAQSRVLNTEIRRTVNTPDDSGVMRVFEVRVVAVDAEQSVIVVNDISAQRQREAALSRYLAPHVVQSLLRDPSELRLGGERQRATILFADIRGFTARAARMRPEAVVELLNRYLSGAVATVFAHEGLLDKFYGDGVMAVFGPPRPRDDDPERALRAAIAMLAEAEALSATLDEPLHISIGLASGTVVAGHIGSPQRMDYTVIGDAVNLASRLEAKAEPGGILCDEATFLAAGLDLPAESFSASIRGRDERFTIYRIG